MTRCPRCRLLKPDAVFLKHGRYGGVAWETCQSCRTHISAAAGMTSVKMMQKSKVPETPAPPTRAALIFREELQKFRERGSPVVSRPYITDRGGFTFGGAAAEGTSNGGPRRAEVLMREERTVS